ncbi:MAG: apolipoprotein N-acyltransferase, partial [Proteobacteria bacterium]|nr:apolipoprotein N-acyltransferase [Pseudomonadota bacterium]
MGGVLLPFAFAPFNVSYLAIVSLALLFASWVQASPWRGFLRGYLFGVGKFGVGVSWVYVSMHRYGGAGVLEASLLTALFVLYLALYPALAGFLASKASNRADDRTRLLLVFPGVWTLVEWFRGWFLTGFPWLEVGATQVDTPLGQGLAPILGSLGVGWVVALIAGLMLLIIDRRHGMRRIALMLIASLFLVCAGLSRIQWAHPSGKSFRATMLQGNVPQNLKWQPEVQRATLDLYAGMTREHWDSQLIIWPETAIPAFYHQVKDSYLAGLQEEALRHGTDLLIGMPVVDLATERYYNAVVSVGQQPGMYFKRHMVPFGEFIPFRPVLGFVMDMLQIPLSDFARGTASQTPLVAAGHALSASICYEDIFGHESRFGLPSAAYLVNVTNDAWFGDSMQPHQHLQMARMRSLETGRYMLRATNTGVTAAISPRGQVVAEAPLFSKTAVSIQISPMQGM